MTKRGMRRSMVSSLCLFRSSFEVSYSQSFNVLFIHTYHAFPAGSERIASRKVHVFLLRLCAHFLLGMTFAFFLQGELF